MIHSLNSYLNAALDQTQCCVLEMSHRKHMALVFKELSVHLEGDQQVWRVICSGSLGGMRKGIAIDAGAGKVLRLRITGDVKAKINIFRVK